MVGRAVLLRLTTQTFLLAAPLAIPSKPYTGSVQIRAAAGFLRHDHGDLSYTRSDCI
jgi:hypothetical protein